MAVVKWEFEDPTDLSTYTFAVNPSDDGSPAYAKSITYQNTSATDGNVIAFEGRDAPRKGSFSGTLLTEAQYNAFVTWWGKRNQINVTDDLGREFSIIIESFTPKRERAIHHPWKHSYSIDYTIVDWA